MNDFHGLLSSDFGLKPQGKSAPMAPPRHNPTSTTNSALNFEIGGRPSSLSKSSSGSFLDDRDTLSRPPSSTTNRKPQDYSNLGGFDDVFVGGGGNSRSGGNSNSPVILDSIFSGSADTGSNFSSMPVFDKPVYDDDDVFDGVSGLKSSSSGRYDGLFNSSSKKNDAFDDFLGGLGRRDPESKGFRGPSTRGVEKGIPGFDDLLNGFGVNSASVPTDKTSSSSSWRQKSTASGGNMHSNIIDDPFVVLGTTTTPAPSSSVVFDGPVEHMSNLNRSNSNKVNNSAGGPVFDDINPFEGFGKFVPAFSSERGYKEKDNSPLRTEHGAYGRQTFDGIDDKSNIKSPERGPEKKIPAEDYGDSPRTVIEIPSASDSHRSVPDTCAPSYADPNFNETNFDENVSPRSQENTDSADDIWLSVSEVPLFTQPTAAPPPSRPPPPRPAQFPRAGRGSFTSHAKKKDDDYSAFSSSTAPFQSPRSIPVGAKSSSVSVIEELENFAMGKSQNNVNGSSDVLSGENMDANSVAAAMKEAMDKAEAKFKHVKEVRERENAKAARMQQISEDKTTQDARERDLRERQEQLEREHQERMEEEEKRQREEEERRRIEREREEKEREQRKLVRERELGRQAVERATREARERAAAGARARAERAAVERAQAEARERAERAAVQRVQAEARERAARDAKEKAEKVAAEARERARAHAREKEAQERAAAAAAAAKASQQKNDDDLETFFGMGSRAGSAPRPRDPVFNTQFQNKQVNEDVRTSAGSTNNMGKASYSANIVDDLSSIFGGPPSSGEFQEVEGESEERRRARLERHQRTQERAAKAVAEKNHRDLQAQTEQAERHRIAETLDVEIRRWASGKEGNLRALLSTLQYVLWPESGWHPVSLTDLITAASVKKVYRKATLCIHPDKVQQKGATLPQKYIAEKVFDILKEAWNKFNSEELF